MEKLWKQWQTLFSWAAKITADSDCSHEIKRHLLLRRKVMTNQNSILKSWDITLPTKVHLSQSYGFSSSQVWMWELDQKKAEHWRIDVFKLCCWRRLLRIPALKGDQTVNPKGTQPWIFIGRNDDEAEAPILRPPRGKCQLISKRTLILENIEDRRRRGRQGDIVGWHHRLKGHEFEQTPGDDEGQGSLGCCSPWGCKELDMTEWLSNNHVPPTTQTQTQTHTLLKTKVRRNIVYLEYIL